MSEKPLLEILTDSYKGHDQEDTMIPVLHYISKNILPYYDRSPYKFHGVDHITRKMLFVDMMYQWHPELMLDMDEVRMTFVAALSEIALVWKEFDQKYRVSCIGSKSAKIVKEHFTPELQAYTDYDKFEPVSWVDGISYCDIITSKTYYRFTPYSKYGEFLYVANAMGDIFYMTFPEYLKAMEDDFHILYSTWSDERIHEIAINRLYAKYNPTNGVFRLQIPTFKACKELHEKFKEFQDFLKKEHEKLSLNA